MFRRGRKHLKLSWKSFPFPKYFFEQTSYLQLPVVVWYDVTVPVIIRLYNSFYMNRGSEQNASNKNTLAKSLEKTLIKEKPS